MSNLKKMNCKHEFRFLRSELLYDAVQDELHSVKVAGSKDIFYCIHCLAKQED